MDTVSNVHSISTLALNSYLKLIVITNEIREPSYISNIQ